MEPKDPKIETKEHLEETRERLDEFEQWKNGLSDDQRRSLYTVDETEEEIDYFFPMRIPEDVLKSPQMQRILMARLEEGMRDRRAGFSWVSSFVETYKIPEEKIYELGGQLIYLWIGRERMQSIPHLVSHLKLPVSIFQEQKIKESVESLLFNSLAPQVDVPRVKFIIAELHPSEETLKEAATDALVHAFEGLRMYSIQTIFEALPVPAEALSSPKMQGVVRRRLFDFMLEYPDSFEDVVRLLKISKEVLHESAMKFALHQTERGRIDRVIRIAIKSDMADELKQNNEFRLVVLRNFSEFLRPYRDFDQVRPVIEFFNLAQEEIEAKILESIRTRVKVGDFRLALEAKSKYHIPSELLETLEFKKIAKEGISNKIYYDFSHSKEHYDQSLEKIGKVFGLSEPDLKESQRGALLEALMIGNSATCREIADIYHIPNELDEFYPDHIATLAKNFDLETVNDIREFSKANFEFFVMVHRGGKAPILTKSDMPQVGKLHIRLHEAENILKTGRSLESMKDSEELFKILCDFDSSNKEKNIFLDYPWEDQVNIARPFEAGANLFRHERMFAYIDRPGLSRHDALHNFHSINSIFVNNSELSADQFYGNILFQVSKDGAQYDEGTAHHKLNAIASSFPSREGVGELLEKLREYGDKIERLKDMAETFKSPKDIFASWKSLKKFHEVSQLMQRAEMLNELSQLKEQGKFQLSNYIETLAFHPNSSVDMEAAMMFWREPSKFFAIEEIHAADTHEKKKPSNYTSIPHLDLSPEELRDAIVEGPLDKLQVFSPMEVQYTFSDDALETAESLKELFQKAIGSKKNNIKGEGGNPGKLFAELGKILKSHGIDTGKWFAGEAELPDEPKLLAELTSLAYLKNVGLHRAATSTVYIAKINRKSDPNGVLAGNDTACCMPFGSGKNNVYMANPDTSLFTVQIKKPDGNLRTIAQSVLTKDIDIGKPIPEILAGLNASGERIDAVLPETALKDKTPVIACDNIEINPNFQDPKTLARIADMYKLFFHDYINTQHSQEFSDRVVVGTGFTDLHAPLDKIPNTYAPKAPVGYSDKTGAEVYVIPTMENLPIIEQRIIQTAELKPREIVRNGVGNLTFEDTLAVAYIEGKAYHDNETLMTYLHNMENALIAKDINNTSKNRPNLSLKYVDGDGFMKAYILAYEGRRSMEGGEQEPVVYVSDLASDKDKKGGAGLRVGSAFMQKYFENYPAQGKLFPLYFEARETTSYRLVDRLVQQLNLLGAPQGLTFEKKEHGQEAAGPDTMHHISIRPVSIGS